MTARNRNKSSAAADKPRDEAVRKSPKPPASVSSSATLPKLARGAVYLALVAGVALACAYLHQALSDLRERSFRLEESVEKFSAATRDMDGTLEQMEALRGALEGLQEVVSGYRSDLDAIRGVVHQEGSKTQRLGEALQTLQVRTLDGMSKEIESVREAQRKEASSLQKSLEERVEQLSGSLARDLQKVSHHHHTLLQADLQELKARVEQQESPGLLEQELSSIVTAVADLHIASEVSSGNAAVLREQIAAVGAELQTRNKEVASVSEEISSVRSLVQSSMGTLREDASAARAGVQTLSDLLQALSGQQEQLETRQREELLKAEKRLKEMEELLTSLLSEHTSTLSAVQSQRSEAERDAQGLRAELQELRSRMEERESRPEEQEESDSEHLADGEDS